MRFKLFLLLIMAAVLPSMARPTGVAGTVVDAATGAPLGGASIMLNNQSIFVTSGPSGEFRITNASAGDDVLVVAAFGHNDLSVPVTINDGSVIDLGHIRLVSVDQDKVYYEMDQADMLFDESELDDEEGNAQSIAALNGASDNIY